MRYLSIHLESNITEVQILLINKKGSYQFKQKRNNITLTIYKSKKTIVVLKILFLNLNLYKRLGNDWKNVQDSESVNYHVQGSKKEHLFLRQLVIKTEWASEDS